MFRFWKRKNKAKEIIEKDISEFKDLDLTSENIKALLCGSSDIVFRELYINGNKNLKITLCYVDGLIDSKVASENVLKPLLQEKSLSKAKNGLEIVNLITHGTLYYANQKVRDNIRTVISDIMNGSVGLIFNKDKLAVTFDIKGYEKRSITEPTGENVIKGSKDSFIEDLRTNTATIRRNIKTHKLVIEEATVGKQTLTNIAIVYVNGITNQEIVAELKKRLDKINVDNALTAGIIEENIVDNKYSVFPQVIFTVRTDKFCANILEGRVGLIIDGLPIAYIVPATFDTFLQAPEDYSYNFIVSSVIRFLRHALAFVTLFLPAFYVSLTTFSQEMIPTELALVITASKEGVPFPSFIEVIFMLIAFETLIEAGLRLPKNIGQAVSIVGAVVVGQAAVEAKLISPAVVVIIAITAIASFTMPNQDFSNALRLWRFAFVIVSSIIGLFGLSLGAILLLHHLSKMEVYGIPYMATFVGEDNVEIQDSIFRFPFTSQKKRPICLMPYNKIRQGEDND